MAGKAKDIGRLIKDCKKQGLKVEAGAKNWKVYCPDGETIVVISFTPKGNWPVKTAKKMLAKAGVNI